MCQTKHCNDIGAYFHPIIILNRILLCDFLLRLFFRLLAVAAQCRLNIKLFIALVQRAYSEPN